MYASFWFVSLRKGLFYSVVGLADEAEGSDQVWLSFSLQELILFLFFFFSYVSPSRMLSVVQVEVILIKAGNEALFSSHNLTFFIL